MLTKSQRQAEQVRVHFEVAHSWTSKATPDEVTIGKSGTFEGFTDRLPIVAIVSPTAAAGTLIHCGKVAIAPLVDLALDGNSELGSGRAFILCGSETPNEVVADACEVVRVRGLPFEVVRSATKGVGVFLDLDERCLMAIDDDDFPALEKRFPVSRPD